MRAAPSRRFTPGWIVPALLVLLLALATPSPSYADSPPADTTAAHVGEMLANADAQTRTTVLYDPAYVSLAYPGGDVPPERGVCCDVVVRALRGAGVDLQKLVHEDMQAHFGSYPKIWGLARPDANIDHRRVPNLETFFRRQGRALPVTAIPSDYLPGDIVSWRLPNGLAHIGLVVAPQASADPARHLCVHNIGAGARVEDVLFAFKITGHFRYFADR